MPLEIISGLGSLFSRAFVRNFYQAAASRPFPEVMNTSPGEPQLPPIKTMFWPSSEITMRSL
jgi:hypothetical protein